MADTVAVCIPTYKRPRMLARLLDAIAQLETDASLHVIVADNDAEGHAGHDLAQACREYRWPLTPIIAQQRGIAQARNRLIEAALQTDAAFIAMIDDDEWPAPSWIAQFLKAAQDTEADVLQGSILFGGAQGHDDIRRPTGPVPMLQGAGNILIRRDVLTAMPAPWFDPAFGLTGGEDRDFFVRLQRAGYRFAWCDEARAHGEVPETRTSLRWRLRRAYSIGNSDMRVVLKHRPGAPRVLIEVGKILAAPLAAILLAAHPERALAKLFRAAGKLSALLGRHYHEYAVTHGA